MEETSDDGMSIQLSMQCAVYTKQMDGTFDKCDRFAFTPLNDDHIKQVERKNHPFFVDNKTSPLLLVCLAHHRFIQNGPKFNEQTCRINLAPYELDERREMEEFLNEFEQYSEQDGDEANKDAIKSALEQLFSEEFSNLHQRYREYKDIYEANTEEGTNSNSRSRAKQENFEALSATTLRRYKKFFKLPNRSGATSKQQLLEGVHEHFESVPIDTAETAANFLHALYHQSNQLDNPTSSSWDLGGGGGNHHQHMR